MKIRSHFMTNIFRKPWNSKRLTYFFLPLYLFFLYLYLSFFFLYHFILIILLLLLTRLVSLRFQCPPPLSVSHLSECVSPDVMLIPPGSPFSPSLCIQLISLSSLQICLSLTHQLINLQFIYAGFPSTPSQIIASFSLCLVVFFFFFCFLMIFFVHSLFVPQDYHLLISLRARFSSKIPFTAQPCS